MKCAELNLEGEDGFFFFLDKWRRRFMFAQRKKKETTVYRVACDLRAYIGREETQNQPIGLLYQ